MPTITPVTLTPKAAAEVQNIFETKNIPKEYSLRIGIKGSGGCSGFTFMLGFDMNIESDLEYVLNGINILVENNHTMYLMDMEVDFHEGADAKGFTFVKKPS